MAHKKGVGSSRNGRDSNPQYRGVKKFGGELVRAGNIIVVASVAALRTGATMKAAAYYASKAAALHLTRALAAEWGAYGIRVNAICPGFFPSKMSSGLLEKIEASVVRQTPLGRLGNDTDLMGAAVYLASDASRHVTGQYIAVDGGASIA